MNNNQSVNTTVNLSSLTSTSGVSSATASSLADGTYTVTLSYQDYLGNPASTDIETSVTIDTTPPVISSIYSAIQYPPGASITWSTNEDATSRVLYHDVAIGSLTYDVTSLTLTTDHAGIIHGLDQVTSYSFYVTSTDAAGNTSTSDSAVFTTKNGGQG